MYVLGFPSCARVRYRPIRAVLEPISSTVVSVPMYKLSRGLEIGPVDKGRVDKTTLLTGKNATTLVAQFGEKGQAMSS